MQVMQGVGNLRFPQSRGSQPLLFPDEAPSPHDEGLSGLTMQGLRIGYIKAGLNPMVHPA